jgi:hypothetical protein
MVIISLVLLLWERDDRCGMWHTNVQVGQLAFSKPAIWECRIAYVPFCQ